MFSTLQRAIVKTVVWNFFSIEFLGRLSHREIPQNISSPVGSNLYLSRLIFTNLYLTQNDREFVVLFFFFSFRCLHYRGARALSPLNSRVSCASAAETREHSRITALVGKFLSSAHPLLPSLSLSLSSSLLPTGVNLSAVLNRENRRRNIRKLRPRARRRRRKVGGATRRQLGSDNGRQWDRIRFLHANFAPGIVP